MTRISQLYLYINGFLPFLFNIFPDAPFNTYQAYDILMLFPNYCMQLGYFQFYQSYMLFTASFDSASSTYTNLHINVTFS